MSDNLQEIFNGNVYVLPVAKTKVERDIPYQLDRSYKSGSILAYVRSSLPSQKLECPNIPFGIQAVPFKINLKKEK